MPSGRRGSSSVAAAACHPPVSADGAGFATAPRGSDPAAREAAIPATHLMFLGVTAVLSLFFLGWRNPSPSAAYAGLVRAVAAAITRDPATVGGYMARLRPATEFFAVAYITGIAITARASLSRRAAMLFHAVLYVALSALGQALLIVAGMKTPAHRPVRRRGATSVNLLLAGLVVTRLTFTTYAPRATIPFTTVPAGRRTRCWPAVRSLPWPLSWSSATPSWPSRPMRRQRGRCSSRSMR
jgi:hypothetical protein